MRPNWKRSTHRLAVGLPFTMGGWNVHCFAAFIARRAKYWLGPWVAKVACVTLPEESTLARMLTRTCPVTVRMALWDGSGITRCSTAPPPAVLTGSAGELAEDVPGLGFGADSGAGSVRATVFCGGAEGALCKLSEGRRVKANTNRATINIAIARIGTR